MGIDIIHYTTRYMDNCTELDFALLPKDTMLTKVKRSYFFLSQSKPYLFRIVIPLSNIRHTRLMPSRVCLNLDHLKKTQQ
jgi:hypothetical protein